MRNTDFSLQLASSVLLQNFTYLDRQAFGFPEFGYSATHWLSYGGSAKPYSSLHTKYVLLVVLKLVRLSACTILTGILIC